MRKPLTGKPRPLGAWAVVFGEMNLILKILYVVLNNFTNDTRVLRAATTGLELGGRVTIFALLRSGLPRSENIGGAEVKRFRAITSLSSTNPLLRLVGYVHVVVLMILQGVRLRPDLVHANDLPALPLGFLIARTTGAKLIYDSHELWADSRHRLLVPGWLFRMMRGAERFFARRADAVMTVSEAIADYMARDLNIAKPVVVRNVPMASDDRRTGGHPLRGSLSISADVPLVLYQGGMSKGRDLFTLLKAMGKIKHPTGVMVFLGNGPLVPPLETAAQDMGIRKRVFFHPEVPPAELHRWTQEATLGICPMEGNCTSHTLSLPNKLFEYIQAGVPVLASDLPEMKRIVSRYGVGEVYTAGDVAQLAGEIDKILSNLKLRETYRQAAMVAAKTLHWGVEKETLIGVYQKLLLS